MYRMNNPPCIGPIILTNVSSPPMYFIGIAIKKREIVDIVSRIPEIWKNLKLRPPPSA